MYVEAEAKMDTYQAQDGSNRTSLNLLQRMSLNLLAVDYDAYYSTGKFEALSRPQNRDASNSTTGAESDTNAAEEPLSGVGAS